MENNESNFPELTIAKEGVTRGKFSNCILLVNVLLDFTSQLHFLKGEVSRKNTILIHKLTPEIDGWHTSVVFIVYVRVFPFFCHFITKLGLKSSK